MSDLYEEHLVSTRNEVVRLANKIIKEMRKTGKKYTIIWAEEGNVKFIKDWQKKKSNPKMTTNQLRLGITNALRGKIGLEKL
jgi:hypothetical protein